MRDLEQRIWSDPLTRNEEEIIHAALKSNNAEQIKKWCGHLLKMTIAQRERVA